MFDPSLAQNKRNLSIPAEFLTETVTNFPVTVDLDALAPNLVSDLGANNLKFAVTSDQIDDFTSLLISSDSSDGSTEIVDSSKYNNQFITTGSVIHSTEQKKFGNTSLKFDGSSYIETTRKHNFEFGSSDFTIDFWAYHSDLGSDWIAYIGLWGDVTAEHAWWVGSHDGKIMFYYNDGVNFSSSSSYPVDEWFHVAVVRNGADLNMYVNGILSATHNIGTTVIHTSTNDVRLGHHDGSGSYYNGYLDEIRVVKGVAKWTEDFTPPTNVYAIPVQCPAEIECWETSNHVIHTKIPALSTKSDNIFTLVWDVNQDDNTDYVGVTGSDPAKNVWDDNFVAVYHMAQDPSGTAPQILDSTSNGNDATSRGTMPSSALIDGELGKALEFDGSDDGVISPTLPAMPDITIEAKSKFSGGDDVIASLYGYAGSNSDIQMFGSAVNKIIMRIASKTSDTAYSVSGTEENLFTVTFDQSTFKSYINGSQKSSQGYSHTSTTTEPLCIGIDADDSGAGSLGNWLAGTISEVRVSKIARSDVWIKLTYLSLTGKLVKTEFTASKSERLKILSKEYPELITDFPVTLPLDSLVPQLVSDLDDNKLKLKVECNVPDSDTKLLVISDGKDESQEIKDSSIFSRKVSVLGTAHSSNECSLFGETSIKFDNDEASLQVNKDSSLDFGARDFTIDWWEYRTSTADQDSSFVSEFDRDKPGILLGYHTNGKLFCYFSKDGVNWTAVEKTLAYDDVTNRWMHYAVTRCADSIRLFANGSLITEFTYTDVIYFNDTYPWSIGLTGIWRGITGYIDEFRVTMDKALWTDDFTPPGSSRIIRKQCPVEIDCWEEDNHVIHTKVPALRIGKDTMLSIYWNESHDDNSGYVGETGSIPAQEVWDDNFVAVYHMAQDPSVGGACILDSTQNANHGTPYGSMTSGDLVNGLIGKALDFDGSDDYLNLNSILKGLAIPDYTVEFGIQTTQGGADHDHILFSSHKSDDTNILRLANDTAIRVHDTDGSSFKGTIAINTGDWYNVALVGDTTEARLFIDGLLDASGSKSVGFKADGKISVAQEYDATNKPTDFAMVTVSYIRVSRIPRSDTWIKLTYLSLTGNLVINEWEKSSTLAIMSSLVESKLENFPAAINFDSLLPGLVKDLGDEKLKIKITEDVRDDFTSLLIHSDNDDGSTSFIDSSDTAAAITSYNGVKHSSDYSKFGKSSIYFDGTDDYLTVDNITGLNLAGLDWTIECFIYCTAFSSDEKNILAKDGEYNVSYPQYDVSITNGEIKVRLGDADNTSNKAESYSFGSITQNEWWHICASMKDGVLYCFLNGSLVLTETNPHSMVARSDGLPLYIGHSKAGEASWHFDGYLDEIRISAGVARWTEDFTPPTAPYEIDSVIHCPVEIECWEEDNHVVHTKIPVVSDTDITKLKVSWDIHASDNTDYVGATGSDPAKNVWDNNFIAVYHMAQDPSTGGACILDSTQNANHGTPNGSMTSDDLVDGSMGKALNFDGSDDYIDIPILPSMTAGTIESILTPLVSISSEKSVLSAISGKIALNIINDTTARFLTNYAWDTDHDVSISPSLLVGTVWNYTGVVTGSKLAYFFDGENIAEYSYSGTIEEGTECRLASYGNGNYTNIRLHEIRISQTARSDAWIKLTNTSLTNELFVVYSDSFNWAIANYHDKIIVDSSAVKKYMGDYYLPVDLVRVLPSILDTMVETDKEKIAFTFRDIPFPAEVLSFSDTEALYFIKTYLMPQADTRIDVHWDPDFSPNPDVADHSGYVLELYENFVGVYHFNTLPSEGVFDSSISKLDLAPSGIEDSDVVNGPFGTGLYIDGTNSKLTSESTDYSALQSGFTLFTILKIVEIPTGTHEIINFGVTDSPAISFIDGNIGVGLSGDIVDTGVKVVLHEPIALAITCNTDTLTVYYNSEVIFERVVTNNSDLSDTQLSVFSEVKFDIFNLFVASVDKGEYWVRGVQNMILNAESITKIPDTAFVLPDLLRENNPFGEELLRNFDFNNCRLLSGIIRQQAAYHIKGIVSIEGSPVHRRVSLLDRQTLKLIDSVWSDPKTGEYKFEGVDPDKKYVVLCDDYNQVYNAAVADWVISEDDT